MSIDICTYKEKNYIFRKIGKSAFLYINYADFKHDNYMATPAFKEIKNIRKGNISDYPGSLTMKDSNYKISADYEDSLIKLRNLDTDKN
jgi:hypothetical protein